MAAIVADASPLIAFHQIEHLRLLEQLFSRIQIPPAVAHEVAPSLPGLPVWVLVRDLAQPISPEILRAGLGRGETEALSLAQQIGAELLIVDDRPARRLALHLGLPVAGTAGILARAKRAALIPAARPLIDQLLSVGFRVSPGIIKQALEDAGEP